MDSKISVTMTVKRGPQSWAFLYIVLGFAISIEGSIVSMLPLQAPTNIALYLLVSAITARLIIDNGWCQNKLIELKNFYEDKGR